MLKFVAERLAQSGEKSRIGRGVRDHLRAQGSGRPVGPLKPLVGGDAESLLQDGAQADAGQIQKLSGDSGVKQTVDPKPGLTVHQAEVVVRIMEHEFSGIRVEPPAERLDAAGAQRINDSRGGRGRQLYEIDPVAVPVETGCLGVDSDDRFVDPLVEQRLESGGVGDDEGRTGGQFVGRRAEESKESNRSER